MSTGYIEEAQEYTYGFNAGYRLCQEKAVRWLRENLTSQNEQELITRFIAELKY